MKPNKKNTASSATTKPVRFELSDTPAQEVLIAGSFNNWQPHATPMIAQGNGRWVKDLTLTAGQYEYLFVVDGQWQPDPRATESTPNPYGGRNSVVTVNRPAATLPGTSSRPNVKVDERENDYQKLLARTKSGKRPASSPLLAA